MKRLLWVLAGLLVGFGVFAQEEPGGPPPAGQGQPPRFSYDATKEVSLQGTITTVNLSTQGPGPFVSLSFLADGTTYNAMVGPQAVLSQNGVTLAQGDALTLVGVATTGPRGAMFLVRTLTKDGTLVTLLKQDGSPVGRP